MAGDRDNGVRTVLRGEQLRQQLEGGATHRHASAVTVAPPSPAPETGNGKLINGVPASAAVHCCGRGCAHCRIYWRQSDV